MAVDLTERMLVLARKRGVERAACGDAGALPFPDGTFDAVFVGYGLRNFPNLAEAVREIERVTRPGGLLVSLDFFLPANPVLRRLYLAYLYAQGAFWGPCCTSARAFTPIFPIRWRASFPSTTFPPCCAAPGTPAWIFAVT